MYLTTTTSRSPKGKTYHATLLRQSYRVGKQVKNRTIANVTHLPRQDLNALRLAIKYRHDLSLLGSLSLNVALRQGPSVGAVWTVAHMAERLGITKALGRTHQGKLALFQVLSRVIYQGSRLSSVRLAETHMGTEVLGVTKRFDEDALYANLHWLAQHQTRIEDTLFTHRHQKHVPTLYLYDVTSTYLEGTCNELATFGYNRDKKRGKQQIVIGLLCDHDGEPLSIDVFTGNTQDPQTVPRQIKKVAERFDGRRVTFVGDRGMMKSLQIEQLSAHNFHYITAITKPQIRSLIGGGILQLSLFDAALCEVQDGDTRYILRRNALRARELEHRRTEKEQRVTREALKANMYLKEHPRAKPETQQNHLNALRKKLKAEQWITIESVGRTVSVVRNDEARRAHRALDGCYVLKTDVKKKDASKEIIHDRYKDLAFVESAFRTMKTAHLEVRPVHVRSKKSTCGHVFVVSLAYKIIRALTKGWENEDTTVEEGLTSLRELCATEIVLKDGGSCMKIPEPRPRTARLLKALDISLPTALPPKVLHVVTRKKLVKA